MNTNGIDDSSKIEITSVPFVVSKTSNKFHDVKFRYGADVWEGCIPSEYKELSLSLSLEKVEELAKDWYIQLNYTNREKWREQAKTKWGTPESTETGRVFLELLTGEWECRSCGTGKINDQPAARIRDIKKRGYIVATKSKYCPTCDKRTYQDILVMIDVELEARPEYRKPISAATKKKILQTLNYKDIVFCATRTETELIVDHKFPSQRWDKPESDNSPDMSEAEIRSKFQLLTNQTNMLKSRFCDRCVKNSKRGIFMGIGWYNEGDENWQHQFSNEDGCKGCPWYDVETWRNALTSRI